MSASVRLSLISLPLLVTLGLTSCTEGGAEVVQEPSLRPVKVVEVIRVDPVGVGLATACLQLMLLHARLLNVMVGLFVGRTILDINHLLLDQCA